MIGCPECGYPVRQYGKNPIPSGAVWQTKASGEGVYRPAWGDAVQDVVERDCPHGNGTVIQHCPQCNHQVGMWGCGPVGSMECDCWEDS